MIYNLFPLKGGIICNSILSFLIIFDGTFGNGQLHDLPLFADEGESEAGSSSVENWQPWILAPSVE